jgi:urease alpha subunit
MLTEHKSSNTFAASLPLGKHNAYDPIIKNAKIVDGSGLPGFHGDVAASGGRIVQIGRQGSLHRLQKSKFFLSLLT